MTMALSPQDRPVSDCRPPLASVRPRYALPPGACDTHCHVFGPADVFPYAEGRSYAARRAAVPAGRAARAPGHPPRGGGAGQLPRRRPCRAAGRAGPQRRPLSRRGAAGGGCDPASVRALHDAGVRGARFNFVPHLGGAPDPAVFDHVVGLIAPAGLASVPASGRRPAARAAAAPRALPLPFVIDHMGRVRAADGLDAPAFRALLDLADLPGAWVKCRAWTASARAGGRSPRASPSCGRWWRPCPSAHLVGHRLAAPACAATCRTTASCAMPSSWPVRKTRRAARCWSTPGAAVRISLTPAPRARPSRVATTLFDSKGDKHVEETILRRPAGLAAAGAARARRPCG